MDVFEDRRVIVSEPDHVTVKYAGGERDAQFDNRVTEVVVVGEPDGDE